MKPLGAMEASDTDEAGYPEPLEECMHCLPVAPFNVFSALVVPTHESCRWGLNYGGSFLYLTEEPKCCVPGLPHDLCAMTQIAMSMLWVRAKSVSTLLENYPHFNFTSSLLCCRPL